MCVCVHCTEWITPQCLLSFQTDTQYTVRGNDVPPVLWCDTRDNTRLHMCEQDRVKKQKVFKNTRASTAEQHRAAYSAVVKKQKLTVNAQQYNSNICLCSLVQSVAVQVWFLFMGFKGVFVCVWLCV